MTRSPDFIWLQGWIIHWLNDNINITDYCNLFALLSFVLFYPHTSSPQDPKMAAIIPGRKC